MKKITTILAICSILAACNNDKKPTVTASTAEAVSTTTDSATAVNFTVDTTASTLQWEGYEGLSLGKSEHNGALKITDGSIGFQNNVPVTAKFTIPLNTLTVADIPTEKPGNAKLVKHLLDPDFFDATKFPTANFELTKAIANGADSMTITGNLSLKGIAKSITFSAATKLVGDVFTFVTPKFYINRKDWGIVYRSENSLGDELIRPEMGIVLNITAKK